LHDGSFDQLLRLTLHALCHRAKHRIRDHAAVWWRVSGPLRSRILDSYGKLPRRLRYRVRPATVKASHHTQQ
jgi:hypothetical protein